MRFRSAAAGFSLVILSATFALADRGRSRVAVPSDDHGSGVMRISGHDGRADASGPDSPAQAEIRGTVAAIDCVSNAMTVTTASGDVSIAFDAFTVFRRQGSLAACSDLQAGASVEVSGTPQIDGSILAAGVSIESAETEDAEISGTVASIDCAGNSMVVTTGSGDVTVTFDPSTVFRSHDAPAACADVQPGDAVEVSGAAQGDGSIAASRVSFEAPETEDTEISGTVSSIDCGASSMVVTTGSGDVAVDFDGSTAFLGKDDVVAACSDVAAGDFVEVSGALESDGSILASKVSFETPELQDAEVRGTILSTDNGAQTFLLATDGGSVTIAVDSNTVIQNDGNVMAFADLGAGMSVEVKGVVQGDGSILAATISIESGD